MALTSTPSTTRTSNQVGALIRSGRCADMHKLLVEAAARRVQVNAGGAVIPPHSTLCAHRDASIYHVIVLTDTVIYGPYTKSDAQFAQCILRYGPGLPTFPGWSNTLSLGFY